MTPRPRHSRVPADLTEVATQRLSRAGLPGAHRAADGSTAPHTGPEVPQQGWTPGDPVPLATWAAYAEASGTDREPGPEVASHPAGHRRGPASRDFSAGTMPRAGVMILVLALAAVALGGYYFMRSQARAVAVPPPRTGGAAVAAPMTSTPAVSAPMASGPVAAPGPMSSPAPAAGGRLLVHVAGRVSDPGVVELPAGARVGDAVTAAGGAEGDADLSAVNLARPVADGEQVYVPAVGEEPPSVQGSGAAAPDSGASADGASGASGDSTAATVDLNAATLAELQTLPGVGPVLAQRILDWRTEHGSFASVEELNEVSGIGDATLAEIAPRARV